MNPLDQDFAYYLAHKAEFIDKYRGKYIVLKDQKLLGVYEDRLTAIKETQQNHELGTFLVQQVSEADDHARFHSRVVF